MYIPPPFPDFFFFSFRILMPTEGSRVTLSESLFFPSCPGPFVVLFHGHRRCFSGHLGDEFSMSPPPPLFLFLETFVFFVVEKIVVASFFSPYLFVLVVGSYRRLSSERYWSLGNSRKWSSVSPPSGFCFNQRSQVRAIVPSLEFRSLRKVFNLFPLGLEGTLSSWWRPCPIAAGVSSQFVSTTSPSDWLEDFSTRSLCP